MKYNNSKKSTNSKFVPKPIYKKKEKKQKPIITNELRVIKDKEFKPELVEPSEKYIETYKALKKKGFFISAKYGDKIQFTTIKEFHVATKNDVPYVVCENRKSCPQGGVSITKKLYKLVRFNDQEIVGLESRNSNPWMMKTVKLPKE